MQLRVLGPRSSGIHMGTSLTAAERCGFGFRPSALRDLVRAMAIKTTASAYIRATAM
jgi:hypothetical protein